jgi:hypothetical protein
MACLVALTVLACTPATPEDLATGPGAGSAGAAGASSGDGGAGTTGTSVGDGSSSAIPVTETDGASPAVTSDAGAPMGDAATTPMDGGGGVVNADGGSDYGGSIGEATLCGLGGFKAGGSNAIEREPNDTAGQASPFPFGGTVCGVFAKVGEIDVYVTNVPATATSVAFTVEGANAAFEFSTDGTSFSTNVALAPGAPIYVKVTSRHSTAAIYKFTLK